MGPWSQYVPVWLRNESELGAFQPPGAFQLTCRDLFNIGELPGENSYKLICACTLACRFPRKSTGEENKQNLFNDV